MAAKAERRDFFLSLDQLDIIARTTLPTTRTTRYPLRKKTRTHFTRSRTKFTRKEIVRSRFLWVQRERERESAFVFPLLELRRGKVNSRETREKQNLLGTHKKIKKRKQWTLVANNRLSKRRTRRTTRTSECTYFSFAGFFRFRDVLSVARGLRFAFSDSRYNSLFLFRLISSRLFLFETFDNYTKN